MNSHTILPWKFGVQVVRRPSLRGGEGRFPTFSSLVRLQGRQIYEIRMLCVYSAVLLHGQAVGGDSG